MNRAGRQHAVDGALELVAKYGGDVCLVTNRRFLFLLDHADDLPPIAVDWCDSRVLQMQRQILYLAAQRRYASLPDVLRQLLHNWREERRYGRRSAWNFAVSPVDLSCLDRVRGRPDRMTLLPNGVAPRQVLPLAKEPYRLIFSGNMDFPPNYESALWFVDEVFPRVLEAAPEARLVIAGANPIEELRRRSNARIQVLGYVENMEDELARSALYVAPLISGSGFRNKVMEALVQGTFVVGTTLAGEFLEDDLRALLLSADAPAAFAQKIVWALQHPDEVRSAVCVLSTKILDRYSWPGQARKLELVLRELICSHARKEQ
jgi:glycosyltransferase involved in cell wall biosynthesis